MQGKVSTVDYSLWQLDSERKEMGSLSADEEQVYSGLEVTGKSPCLGFW